MRLFVETASSKGICLKYIIFIIHQILFTLFYPSFVTTQLKPAWEMFGDDLVINFKPFGKANDRVQPGVHIF